MSNHIFASNKNWNKKVFLDLQKNSKEKWFWSSNPTELKKNIKEQQPRYIFFIHWGWKVEKEIYSKYECVCFHMYDYLEDILSEADKRGDMKGSVKTPAA